MLIAPRRFRRRLTIVCILLVALSGGFLAITSYFTVREYRYRQSSSQADRRVELALLLLPDGSDASDVARRLSEYRDISGFETVAVDGADEYPSAQGFGADAVPASVREDTAIGIDHRSGRTTVNGDPFLVVGHAYADKRVQLYFFFPQEEVLSSVAQFGNVLALGWLTTVLLAAVVGHVVARRTLRPVREAALASRSLANRLLGEQLEPPSDDEFALWTHSFNEVANALEAKITELSDAAERERRFTSDVAHELRTPLTAMTSAASLLEEQVDALPDHTREPARILVGDVHRLRDLVLELLELARLDAGQDAVHVEPLDLGQALASALRPWHDRGQIDVRVDAGTRVLADRARFKRVLSNLVENAIEHGGGNVVVMAEPAGAFVRVRVLDDGPGIPPGTEERVFDRFYKADTGRSRRGSGLGLAIARQHAHAQGGSLRAGNLAAGGACFTFTLPAAPVPGHADDGDEDGDDEPRSRSSVVGALDS